MYEYRCKIIKVVDGDTIDVDIDLGFGVWLNKQRIRLNNIDAPEVRTTDKTEKFFGNLAKDRVKNLLPVGSYHVLRTTLDDNGQDATGKYGRILGEIVMGETTLNEMLVDEKLAVRYHGQNKDDIELAHAVNRQTLMYEGTVPK
jgi:micrococcal nuclease